MYTVVASGNIFRRELSSFILSEAGYEVSEARTAADLITSLRKRQPAVIVLDLQLEDADPGAALRAVRLLSAAPILWIADPGRSLPLLMLDDRPSESVSWPFRSEELTSAVANLLGRADASCSTLLPPQQLAGSAE